MLRDCIEDRRTLKKIRGLKDNLYVGRHPGATLRLPWAWPTIDEILDLGADLASTSASRHGCVPSTSDS